ncbi:DUF4349 domain-containing protein [Nocardioides sp. SR21]|uniref:DUF4349 domain-containing protein n=1 Tax=Nocardioides sp. SR21 TaxID=2919501 RepID=UPI001FAAAD37|nr:DUF4349 domain-containing protein [Nocardioides sp. SR21]
MRTTTRRTHAPLLALVAVALAVGLAGCSGAGDDSDSGADGSAVAGSAPDAALRDGAAAEMEVPADSDLAYSVAGQGDQAEVEPVNAQQVQRAVIRKGNVELRSDDVGKAQFDVEKLAQRYFGEITEEKTTTDDDGDAAYTNLVLRIPTEQFNDAMNDLQELDAAELVAANSTENDVTTKLIDTQTRLAAQRRSIARITVLFDRAESIRDIMSIEAELSRRQADLESLERQAAFLRGQTAMSTITVSIDKTPAKAVKKAEEDDSGFVAGFKAGWDALTSFAVGLATALGALLPWLVVVAILGPPTWLLVRWLRRRFSSGRTGRTPSAA